MCFDTGALPPDPAGTGMGAGSERTVLTADDGNRLATTFARTHQPASAGVAIIPDVRGLHPYYERLAEHLADAGVHAVAIDPHGRTAGAEHRGEGFDHRPHRERIRDDHVRADVRAAAAALRDAGATSVVSMGFCVGGRASLMQASQESVDGVIAFYGPPTRAEAGGSSPLEEARAGLVGRRSWACTAAPTRGSPARTPTRTRPRWTPRGSRTGSSCTPARPTPSSTGR